MLELLLPVNPRKRVDSRRHWAAIAASLVACADWATGAITVTHAAVGAAAGARCGRSAFSHDTVGRVVDDLVAAGVLVCPPGLGGKSRAAFGGRGRNQCPTYFVVDPDAATSADADLRTPPSHVSETVPVVGTTALYKGPISPKFAGFDPSAVPVTSAERRTAALWLRSELHIGAVPNWRVAAMMARHFDRGLSPRQVFRQVCAGPDGAPLRSLPVGEAERAAALARSPRGSLVDMLLGIIGGRLRQWRNAPAPQRPAAPPRRPAAAPGAPAPRTAPRGAALAYLAAANLRGGALRGATA